MRLPLIALPCALLLVAGCGDDAVSLPTTKEDLARLALETLKTGDVERFAPAFPTEADLGWALETMLEEVGEVQGRELEEQIEEMGGIPGVAAKAVERIRSSFEQAREAGTEIWDWSAVAFDGLVREKSASEDENGIEMADVYFMVRAGEREELFRLGKCARMPDRWIVMDGLHFRASPHASLEDAQIRLTKHRLRMLHDMVTLFEMRNGRRPESIQDLGHASGDEESVVDETVVADAWGGPFRLEWVDDEVRLSSAGPDKRFDTGDDVVWPEPDGD